MDLPRPEVTVTDPHRPGAFVAVQEPQAPRLGSRGVAALVVAALVGGTALFAADVARDRRQAGTVRLGLGSSGGQWSTTHDPGSASGTVTGPVRLFNRGARDVRVLSAELAGRRYDAGAVVPAEGGSTVVWLERTVRCPADGSPPPPEREPAQLRLQVETPAGTREVRLAGDGLPFGSVDDSVRSACAHPPLGQSLQLMSTVARLEDREAVLEVHVANEGRRPLRLLSLVPARGLRVRSVDGDPAPMPLVLPARAAGAAVRSLEVRVEVSCSALLGADRLVPLEALTAIVEDEDRVQITSVETLTRDPDLQLRQLAGRSCPSG